LDKEKIMRHYLQSFLISVIIFCLFTCSAGAAPKGEVQKYVQNVLIKQFRNKVTREEPYEFGSDREFVVLKDKALLLKCSDNVDGISETVICWTGGSSSSDILYIYCITEQSFSGGGSPIERVDAAFRPVRKSAVIAEWSREKDGLRLKFVLTDDRKRLNRKFKEFWKRGRFSCGSWKKVVDEDELELTADERIEIFVRLWTEVKYNFANFDLVPEVNWDDVLEQSLPLVLQDQSNEDFARLLVKCVSGLKDGHTEVSMKLYEIFEQAQPALVVKPVEGKAVITEIGGSEELVKANLKIGDKILKIDGRDVREILQEQIFPFIFASTEQCRDNKAYRYLLRGAHNSEVNLRIRSIDGKQRDVVLIRSVDWGNDMPRKEHTNFEYKDLGEGISYVAINTFGTSEVVDKFKQHMDRIRESRGLIIDVRDNGGGNSGNGDRITAFLIDKPIPNSPWKTPKYVAAFQAWGRPEKWHKGQPGYIKPREGMERFSGPIVALMGTESFSAAEDFLVLLHSSRRATLVGGKTGGSTGQPLYFNFDYGVNGRICTKRDTYPDGREFVGVGIIPDVEVHETQKSIAEGQDIVLQKAVEVLKEKIAAL
jgi:C-terminal processing protease CtpA/Prc